MPPYLFGIIGISFFTALMNRIWTNYRFKSQATQQAQPQPAAQSKQQPSAVSPSPPYRYQPAFRATWPQYQYPTQSWPQHSSQAGVNAWLPLPYNPFQS